MQIEIMYEPSSNARVHYNLDAHLRNREGKKACWWYVSLGKWLNVNRGEKLIFLSQNFGSVIQILLINE